MRISDCLLILLHITGGVEQYKISMYLNELIKYGYVEVEGFKYVLTKKGKSKMRRYNNA